jgi:hypothetical protein
MQNHKERQEIMRFISKEDKDYVFTIDSPHIEEAIESISFVRQQYEGKIYYLINPNEILLESIQHLPTH